MIRFDFEPDLPKISDSIMPMIINSKHISGIE
jgi:hypothetical protein